MAIVRHQGLDIYYEVHGEGHPVLLLHGATVNFEFNYAIFGWTQTLNNAGFQVIGLDFRGHGNSSKPHDVQSYSVEMLASDAVAVLDHLDIQKDVLVAGYSIGTAVALHLVHQLPQRFSHAALLATGDGLIGIPPHTFMQTMPALQWVLERDEYPTDLPKHLAAYWNFIENTGADKAALSALSQGDYPHLSPAQVEKIDAPVLLVSGTNDQVLGQGDKLAQTLAQGAYLKIEGGDHFSLATDETVQRAVVDFFSKK